MLFWISSGSVVMSPFSFLILLIRMLSLCPLVSLAKGLSILLISSKNQLLVLLILCIVLFVSTWLISGPSLIISCFRGQHQDQTVLVQNFLREPALGFVDYLYSSFCFYLVYFSPEFDYFLSSTPLG